ncbi:MAG: hypothetical protein ACPLRJ_02070 [Infirmifilum uzonense]|uniref:hypothetical protein n=1 Tax=Infirmifilum uzonense TaxID=1550241 RepID=UPI003C723B7C
MPSPVISHIIGTIAVLQAVVVMLAVFSFVSFVFNMRTQNLMLGEVAESAAREVVELISVYTLGGNSTSYMFLSLPDTLGGQPYMLKIGESSQNVLNITARLQIYSQVRVVVTPNFGRNPVHAVRGTRIIGALKISDSLYMPLPPGFKPVVVAFRDGDSILVGFSSVRVPP